MPTRQILFVEDEAPLRELLSLYFRKKGMEVTTAITVEQAKEVAARQPFDLAIVDINLAGQNGLELLTYLRSTYPKAPVIIFTGLTGQDLVEQAAAGGACAFLQKTQPLATLYAEVCRQLPDESASA